MSLIKRVDIRCDACQKRFDASFEMIANTHGITKGNAAAGVRREAGSVGWTRRKVRGRICVDLCDECSALPDAINGLIWFERQTSEVPT